MHQAAKVQGRTTAQSSPLLLEGQHIESETT